MWPCLSCPSEVNQVYVQACPVCDAPSPASPRPNMAILSKGKKFMKEEYKTRQLNFPFPCMCISAYMYVGVQADGYTWIWRPSINVRLSVTPPPFLMRQSLSVRYRCANITASLASQRALRISCLHLPSLELQVGCHSHPAFTSILGIHTLVLSLVQQVVFVFISPCSLDWPGTC